MSSLVRLRPTALVSLICVVALLTPDATGQGTQSGGITGVVRDSSGAVIHGATVQVYSEETGRLEHQTTTDASGSYAFEALRPGSYRVQIADPGFRIDVTLVTVKLNEMLRHDVVLEVGTVEQQIAIHAEVSGVNSESPTTGEPVDNRVLTTLPLAEPNYLFLLGLSPGTGTEPPDVRTSGRAIVDVSVNGQRTSNNSVTMEGINVDDFNLAHFDYLPIPAPEAIEEFKVATSLYDASLGSKGGGALALLLRSGTSQFHGELYGAVRNDAFNANEWFRAHANEPRGKLIQNVGGAEASGPLLLLKGFWFGNVQILRGRNGVDPNNSSINPTIAAFPTNPDGSTSATLLANQFGLARSQIDPVAVNILNAKSNYYGGTYLIPRPGQPGCPLNVAPPTSAGNPGTFTCNFSKVGIASDTQFTVTYNRPIRHDKDKLQASFFFDDSTAQKPFGTAADLAGPVDNPIQNRFLSLSYTIQISERQLNEVRFGFNRFIFRVAPQDLLDLSQVDATRPNSSSVPGIYRFAAGPFAFGVGANDDRGTTSNTFQIGDSWSMALGRHNLHAGGDLIRYQLNRYNNLLVRGSLFFTPAGASQDTTWLNFITGTVTSASSGAGDPEKYFRAFSADLYFQDDFRWTPRLTLNLGIRWEPMQFSHELFYRSANYDFRLAQMGENPFLFPAGLNQDGVTGTPGVSECALRHCWDLGNLAPRIGFAWDVFGDQTTVLRGGYGIYWQQLSNQTELQGSLGAPFFITLGNVRLDGASLQLASPLPNQAVGSGKVLSQYNPVRSIFTGVIGDVNDPNATVNWTNPQGQLCQISGGAALNCSIDLATVPSADPNLHSPYTQQWNLTLQRGLGKNWTLEGSYVGTHGVGGIASWLPYQARLASPANPITIRDSAGRSYIITTNTLANETLREGAPGLTYLVGSNYISNIGNQIYHAGQFVLLHQSTTGLFFQLGYTYGKNIDNVSGSVNTYELGGSPGRGGASIYNNQNDIAANRALSDLDRRHRLTVNYVYPLPAPKTGAFANQIFQGWELSGLMTFQSGQVFTVSDSSAGGAYGYVLGTPVAVCSDSPVTAPSGDAPLATCTPGTATNPKAAQTSGSIESRLDYYINPNFFSHPGPVANSPDPSATGFGSPGLRNIYRGPFQQSIDFSVLKSFAAGDRCQIQVRSDFFNLFNHPVFSIPTCSSCLDLNGSVANFSRITQTVIPARLIQFGLKVMF